MQIGELIRQMRLERGITQTELAKVAGTSQPAIARLEAGRLSPSLDTVERILHGLGLRLQLTTAEIDVGVDRTLIAQALRLTPAQRLRKLAQERAALIKMQHRMRSSA